MSHIREGGTLVVQDGLWYESLTSSTTAQPLPLALPAGIPAKDVRRTVIQCIGDKVRWRADGSAPTSSTGIRLTDGDILVYDGPPAKIQFIQDATAVGPATLFVHYFGVTGS